MSDYVEPYCKIVDQYRHYDNTGYFIQTVREHDWTEMNMTWKKFWRPTEQKHVYLTPGFEEVFKRDRSRPKVYGGREDLAESAIERIRRMALEKLEKEDGETE